VIKTSDVDDSGADWICYRLDSLESGARIAYYALKIIALLP
jgi:hypothetical protein